MNIRSNLTFLLALKVLAFENEQGWKKDADGNLVIENGNPVWIDANGGEKQHDGGTITRLNSEAKQLRERAEAAEKIAKSFEGVDPEKAKQAIETVGKLDQKKLIDSGEVDKVRQEISTQFQTQIAERDTKISDLQTKYNNQQIANVFKDSDFVKERIAVPVDMFQATFGGRFKVNDNGQIEAYDSAGNRLMSKTKTGEYADPQEALELLVDAYPQKDTILRAGTGSGSGNNGNGGNGGRGRNMKRAEFEKLSPADQAATSAKVISGEMTLSD